jgi:hypothetical protein
MRLVGALSNFEVVRSLKRLDAQRSQLLGQAKKTPLARRRLKPRCGYVQDAVTQVLAAASEPMRTPDIHASVEQLLGRAVSKNSVSSCLTADTRGNRPRFERVAPGLYRLAK